MKEININDILGEHSLKEFASCASSMDTKTRLKIPHRQLQIEEQNIHQMIVQLRSALITHHASPEMLERTRRQRNNLSKIGYPEPPLNKRFPTTDKTRKGNIAEIFLAEYLTSGTETVLPVYRLRYNPNVEQSMKGDDVLAFDFSSNPTRILVGESKFRSTPSKQAVTDIVDGLLRSHQVQIPASLQFVADQLFESGNSELGQKVEDCVITIAEGKLNLQYVGLLLSNSNAASHVNRHTERKLHNLVMISLGISQPDDLISACFNDIEEEAINGDTL